MTGQMHDNIKYKGQDYNLINSSEEIDFDPEAYGVKAEAPHTALWRGYQCEYIIKDDSLCIKDLYVYNHDNEYPPINGVSSTENSGWYYDVNIVLDYRGKIVCGSGFSGEFYIHMGFQLPWAYDRMIEITFDKGLKIKEQNYSELARKLRFIYSEYQEQLDEADISEYKNLSKERNTKIRELITSMGFSLHDLWWLHID
jgi:hypothetical protein